VVLLHLSTQSNWAIDQSGDVQVTNRMVLGELITRRPAAAAER
jgi:hypothetical protein